MSTQVANNEALAARTGSMGLTLPMPGSVRRDAAHVELYQVCNIFGLSPGVSASYGPAFIDVALPAGGRMPRWQANATLQLSQALRLPQVFPLGAKGSHPLTMLDFIAARISVWGDKRNQLQSLMLPMDVGGTKASRTPLQCETLRGGNSVGREFLVTLGWGLVELGLLSSYKMEFQRALPLKQAQTLSQPKPRPLLMAPEPEAARKGLLAAVWQDVVAFWMRLVGRVHALWTTGRALMRSDDGVQRDFRGAMNRKLSELPNDGEVAGDLVTYHRRRAIFTAPLLNHAQRLPAGVRTLLRWPALQVRVDQRDEQRVSMMGAERVLDAVLLPSPRPPEQNAWRYNLVQLRHAVKHEDSQLVVRTLRLPLYFESQLSARKVPLLHSLNIELFVGAPSEDALGDRRALRDVNDALLSEAQTAWRRQLLNDRPCTQKVVTACSELNDTLARLWAPEHGASSIKRFEVVAEQVQPRAAMRIDSQVWPTPAPLSPTATRAQGTRYIVEPLTNSVVQEEYLQRAEERVLLPAVELESGAEPPERHARFKYEVFVRSHPLKEGDERVAGLILRLRLEDDELRPEVINNIARRVDILFGDSPFGSARGAMRLHPRLDPDKRHMLLTVEFSAARLKRAHQLLALYEADRLSPEPRRFPGDVVKNRKMTDEPFASLRKRMNKPLFEATHAVAEALENCAFEDILGEIACLWHLGSGDLDGAEPTVDCKMESSSGIYEETLQRDYDHLERFAQTPPNPAERRELRVRAHAVAVKMERVRYEVLLEEAQRDALYARLRRLFFDYAQVLNVSVIENGAPVA